MVGALAFAAWLLIQEAVRVEAERSTVTVDAEQLEETAAPTLDDALRQVPGFALFRRAGSRTANPTTQGVSLRGIGPSGASRTVVLDDGVPLNDPFGGWVAWGRVPLPAIASVEVVRGGASDLFGSGALGGALRLIPREVRGGEVDARLEAGGLGTQIVSLAGAGLAAEVAHVDGFVPVAPEERGTVDARAGVRRRALRGTLRRPLAGGTGFVRGAAYDERRGNGTRLQVNDTEIRDLSAGFDGAGAALAWSARAWGGRYRYHQTFSAVADDRSAETLVRDQRVPAEAVGASMRAGGQQGVHTLGLVLEGQRVRGFSEETVLASPLPSFVRAGGPQRTLALGVEDTLTLRGGWRLAAGLRADSWRHAGRGESAWSPRLALARVRGGWTASLSATRAFRAPTLNELHRTFRVGEVTTLANPELAAERLLGAEAGLSWRGTRARAGTALFWMRLDDAIAGVTVSSTPGEVLRRRENLGATRTAGLEADAEAELPGGFAVGAGLLLVDPEVVEAEEAALVGRQVPQVSRVQASLRASFRRRGLTAAVQLRAASRAFEDDRNALALPGYGVADLLVEAPLRPGLSLVAAGENLTDARVVAGRTPVTTLATPRTWRLGIRVSRASPPARGGPGT